jgi:hypothetical protein
MDSRLSRRGQVFSGEFILAFLLFMTSLIIIFTIWGSTTRDVMRGENMLSLEETAVDAAEQLVRTPGSPTNWGVGNVTSVGLANESRVLLPSKVKSFIRFISTSAADPPCAGSNYECNINMLGMGDYDVFFNISFMNGTTEVLDGTAIYAGKPPINESNKITVVRTALLNDEISRVYLTVWR